MIVLEGCAPAAPGSGDPPIVCRPVCPVLCARAAEPEPAGEAVEVATDAMKRTLQAPGRAWKAHAPGALSARWDHLRHVARPSSHKASEGA
jgi:hypothetical protein